MEPEQGSSILGPKKLNYDFLMLVRDQKYPEALALGKRILEMEPNNPSVKKFCDFISSKTKELDEMVKQEKEEAEYESVDSDEQEEEEGEEQNEEKEKEEKEGEESSSEAEEKSSSEEEEQAEQEQQPKKEKPKIELRTCSLNPFPHICTRDHE